jgi:hypothetical protein
MNEQNQNRIPDFRDAVTFWKNQTQKMSQRNLDLYAELEDAECRADKCAIAAFVFAVLFLITLGIFLL